ncbi:hypothetical protein BJ912DRAFT_1145231 [Pholiota molesta]|nr:hypothetical protein BJ912DRAFT_1145231 [Pholiota molesta]
MDNLNNTDDIEQHIQSFHASLRAEFLAKVQEVATLHDKMAKLQTRLLDVEQENHTLKIQLALAKGKYKEQHELQPTLMPPAKKEEETPIIMKTGSLSKFLEPPLKRARSPSLEIIEIPKSLSKRLKLEAKAESPAGTHDSATREEYEETYSPRRSESTRRSHSPISNNAGTALMTHSSLTLPDSRKLKFKRQKSEDLKVFSLPQSVADMYLQGAQTLEIYPPPLDLEVPRKFLRESYGGSDQQFLQFTKPEMNPFGPFIRRLVFPELNLNPSMPSQPGDPGLVFASRHEILSNPPWTLFCKRVKVKAIWWDLGEYECVRVGTMTADDFKAQPIIVQREWAKQHLKRKKIEVYVSMCARIALRLASMIPIDDKEEEARIVQNEVKAVSVNKGRPVSEEDIIDAFRRGDEGIDIILMTCVKYDHDFANEMKARYTESRIPSTSANEANASGSKSTWGSRTSKASTSSASKGRRVTVKSVNSPVKTKETTRLNRLRKASRKMIESMGRHSGGSTDGEWSSD